jgi:MFS family permease
LFVPEIQTTYGWSRASIQVAFTIFVLVQTWLAPIEGHFIDKFGPRMMVAFGAVLIGLAWIINSQSTSLMGFYIGAAVGGVGVGSIYPVLYTVACMDLTAAFLAIVVLRPVLARHIAVSRGLMDKERAAMAGGMPVGA